VESGNVRLIQDQAHTLKGMLANLAVTKSAATAALIEQQARADDRGGIATSMAEFNSQVARLMPALEAYLADFER
jgi:HPt (histidine-containing phosphotransfer) domain-containing protein